MIDWSRLITAESGWTEKFLKSHTLKNDEKFVLRTYSIKVEDTEFSSKSLVGFIKDSIKGYILTPKEIEYEEKNGNDPFKYALNYFGKINPTYDGKYGELILYLLVESVLKIPMVVLKIPSNSNDQIKGSDGVFCGDYDGMPAILLGESKTWKNLNLALDDAFKSLDKLYTGAKLGQEYFVAKKSIRELNLSQEELDYMYNSFSPGNAIYESLKKVHPVLIVYSNADFKIEGKKTSIQTIESMIQEIVEKKLEENVTRIKSLCETYKEVSKIHLDFFFIPVKSVDRLRKDLYKAFHGEEWKKAEDTSNSSQEEE